MTSGLKINSKLSEALAHTFIDCSEISPIWHRSVVWWDIATPSHTLVGRPHDVQKSVRCGHWHFALDHLEVSFGMRNLRMSVVGFDIGNENCAIAVAKHGGIDVLLNEESKRETPSVVSFGEKQRFLGSSGAAFATKYPKSTITQIKRLMGRYYKEPIVQKDLQLLPFETSEGPHGGIMIHIQYLNKRFNFTPVEILGMLFSHLKQVTENNLGSHVSDCVIGIPSYFTDLQRREYLNAAFIAGLRPLRLLHDCTAIALGYGMYKSDFSNNGPTNVVFVDIGHSDTQVTIAAFEKGKMTILSHSFDQNLGGRDFDEVLFRHFAVKIKEQYNIDVYSNTRATIRLRVSCEKLKKVLSANSEAPFSIECLIDDKDVNGFIKREEFEDLSMELLERIIVSCRKALQDSGLRVDKIHSIEVVGSGSRIPAIMKKLTSFFGKEPMRTLNGSECVARGCALYCAMLSPTFSVHEYKVQDLFPYSIGLCFDDGENRRHQQVTLFPEGTSFPRNITVPYHGNTTFCCKVFYNNTDFPASISTLVGHFMIRPHDQTSGAEYVKATVELVLNMNGIIEIHSASVLEDKYSLSNLNAFLAWLLKANSILQSGVVDHKCIGYGLSTENHAKETKRGPVKRQNLQITGNYDFLTTIDELQESQKKVQMLTEQDIKVEQSKEIRNTLESFIYDNRSKLLNYYRSIVTDSEHEIITEILQETENWLYEEGDDESEQVYIGKLEGLKKLLDPVENRYKDEMARKESTTKLQTCIKENQMAADLLPSDQRKEVTKECNEAEKWLNHLCQLQDSLAKNATREYCSSSISGLTQAFKRRCKVIMESKPSLPKYNEHVDLDNKENCDGMEVDL
ncbi:hypothetical protein LXL04_027081 [Taraxacum kok-saghyz]